MPDTSPFIAALPMYDWSERREEVDAEWAAIRDPLRARGIAAPEKLTRRNGDMPPVAGGIRDASGAVIAPDPATLDPDGFDLGVLWRHPALLYAQTCYGPIECGLEPYVQVIADPDYSDVDGGDGRLYSSALVMNRSKAPAALVATGGVKSPSDGKAVIDLALLSGLRFAFNGRDSMSGYLGLQKDLAGLHRDFTLFSALLESGAHRASLKAVADETADLAAIDARSWALAQRYSPDVTHNLVVTGWTARRPGLPFICARMLSHLYP